MTTTTTTAPPTPACGAPWIPTETCECLGCNEPIARKHVFINIVRHNQAFIQPTRQHVRAWCAHCKRGWQVFRELRGGVWQLVSSVTEITDGRERAGLVKRVEHIDGTLMAQAS